MDHEEVSLIAINTVHFTRANVGQSKTPVGVLLNTADMWDLIDWALEALAFI